MKKEIKNDELHQKLRKAQESYFEVVKDLNTQSSEKCNFLDWNGECPENIPCKYHKYEKCWKCGGKPTFRCGYVNHISVCGFASCSHEHSHYQTHK